MHEIEGVIKYQLQHQTEQLAQSICLSEITAWRTIMFRLGLIGQDSTRYQGYGFGNISQRLPNQNQQFIISGTQTGHCEKLTRSDYCLVIKADPCNNLIRSTGPCEPSSEALTHAMVYQQNPSSQAVIHVHCPEIWTQTENLQLVHTAANIAYGSTEMAEAVAQLFESDLSACHSLFTLLGHEDGIIAFGTTLQKAAEQIINTLALSMVNN